MAPLDPLRRVSLLRHLRQPQKICMHQPPRDPLDLLAPVQPLLLDLPWLHLCLLHRIALAFKQGHLLLSIIKLSMAWLFQILLQENHVLSLKPLQILGGNKL